MEDVMQNKQVLLADDNKIAREMMCLILESHGLHVHGAASGEEALALIQRQIFDVVLMDYIMEGINGLVTTAQIRAHENHRTVPIIALTGTAKDDILSEWRKAGINDYILKPCPPPVLIEKIRYWLSVGGNKTEKGQEGKRD